jgi:hypothetical protein
LSTPIFGSCRVEGFVSCRSVAVAAVKYAPARETEERDEVAPSRAMPVESLPKGSVVRHSKIGPMSALGH